MSRLADVVKLQREAIRKRQESVAKSIKNESTPAVVAQNTKKSAMGLYGIIQMCDFSRKSRQDITMDLKEQLIGDQGLFVFCDYLMYGAYPQLRSLDLSNNLLTDSSLSTLSTLLGSGACPLLKSVDISGNYINHSELNSFFAYCNQTHPNINVQYNSLPNHSLSSSFPPSQVPFLSYLAFDSVVVGGNDSVHAARQVNEFTQMTTLGQPCAFSDQRPIAGLQLFFYGVGEIAVRVKASDWDSYTTTGVNGEVVCSNNLLPLLDIELGVRETNLVPDVIILRNEHHQVCGFTICLKFMN